MCVCVRACVRACMTVRARASYSLRTHVGIYCSARDEWLIMKLCMYVGYHDANNCQILVVTQLNFKNICVWVSPKTCRHITRRMMNVWLWNFAGMPGTMVPTMCQILVVTQLNFKTFVCVSESLERHVAILLGAWWMADYETLHVRRVPWCQQCVKFWWWPSDPVKLKNVL